MRVKLHANLHDILRVHGEQYRTDPELAVRIDASHFSFDLVLRDPADGRLYQFTFVVDDSRAVYGVLVVVYVEDKTMSGA